MHRISFAIATTLLLSAAGPAVAVGMDMPMSKPNAMTPNSDYRFELSGPPKAGDPGKSIVSVQLMHSGKPIVGAIIIQSRADMGPIGMAAMTAPIKSLGEQPPGTYRFEVSNGSVWQKADNWSLSFGAKVQGVAQTVSGNLTVKLMP